MHVKLLRIFLVMLGAVLLCEPGNAWRQPDAHHAGTPGPIATVPLFYTELGQILIDTQLAGATGEQEAGRFVLDSGAGNCLIAQSLADKLGLISQPAIGGDGQPLVSDGQPVRQVIVSNLTIGGLGVRHVLCLVFDDKTLHAMTGQDVDGFLGGNLFDTIAVLLDFGKHQATFFDHGSVTPFDLKSVGMDAAKAVPLTPVPDSRWFTCSVQMQNGAKTTMRDLVVDTGCVTTVLSHASADQAGLTGPMGWRGHRRVLTEAGTLSMTAVLLPSLAPGGAAGAAAQHGTMVTYTDGSLPADMAETLGLNVLDHYRVLLDFPGLTLYLASPQTPDTPPAK